VPSVYLCTNAGVICDSAGEIAITGWKAAGRIWNDMPKATPQAMIDRFRLVRPIIETSYETILAMRLLYLEETIEAFYSDGDKIQALFLQAQTTVDDLHNLFMETRDGWIDSDSADWVNRNPLFAGVATKLLKLGQRCHWYVITRKQEL